MGVINKLPSSVIEWEDESGMEVLVPGTDTEPLKDPPPELLMEP